MFCRQCSLSLSIWATFAPGMERYRHQMHPLFLWRIGNPDWAWCLYSALLTHVCPPAMSSVVQAIPTLQQLTVSCAHSPGGVFSMGKAPESLRNMKQLIFFIIRRMSKSKQWIILFKRRFRSRKQSRNKVLLNKAKNKQACPSGMVLKESVSQGSQKPHSWLLSVRLSKHHLFRIHFGENAFHLKLSVPLGWIL